MEITQLNSNLSIATNRELSDLYINLETLLDELRKRHLPENIVGKINVVIEKINASTLENKQQLKFVAVQLDSIISTIEQEINLVPKNHYRRKFKQIGPLLFGVPLGAAIGLIFKHIELIGAFLPVGIAIGFLIGTRLDKKALKENRQLSLEY